jgi:hypothetical protein
MGDFLAELASEYQSRLTAAGLAPSSRGSALSSAPDPGSSYPSSRSSGSGAGGYVTGGSSGSGYSTICNDGTVFPVWGQPWRLFLARRGFKVGFPVFGFEQGVPCCSWSSAKSTFLVGAFLGY